MTNKRIWVTSSGMVHYREPEEQEAKEYVEVTESLPQVSASVALETESGVAVEAGDDMPAEVWVAIKNTVPPMMVATNQYYTGSETRYVRADLANAPKAVEDKCKSCGGDGIERCDNPDHGLLNAMSFRGADESACPCCGHDEQYRMKHWDKDTNKYVWNKCPDCPPTAPNAALDAVDTLLKFAKRDFAPDGLDALAETIKAALRNTETKGCSVTDKSGSNSDLATVNAQLLEALKKLLETSAMQQKYGGGMPTWIFEKAKAAIAAAEKTGV